MNRIKVLILAFCLYSLSIQAESFDGKCGDKAYWRYDESSKTLIIEGTGSIWFMEIGGRFQPYSHLRGRVDKLDIKWGITEIGPYAFYNMGVKSITLPTSLQTISYMSFCNNAAWDVVIPYSVTSIGEGAFIGSYGGGNVRNIAFNSKTPPQITEHESSFWYDELRTLDSNGLPLIFSYESIRHGILYVPEEAIEIFAQAREWKEFKHIRPYDSYNAPHNQCGPNMFWDIDISTDDLIIYGKNATMWPMGLNGKYQPWHTMQSRVFPEVYYDTYIRDNINSIIAKEGVMEIDDYAFYDLPAKSVSLPKTLGHIMHHAFDGNHFENITIYEATATLGKSCFASPGNYLKEIINYRKEPQTVWSRDSGDEGWSFNGMPLNDVILYVPDESVDKYKNHPVWKDFKNIKGLSAIFCGESIRWDLENGTLKLYGTGDIYTMNYEGKDQPWFKLRNEIKEVIIEEGIKKINYCAFAGVNMKSVTIPNSVTEIVQGAFSKSSLESITIPETVTTLGTNLFDGCTKLTKIFSLAKTPQKIQRNWLEHAFSGINMGTITLIVPDESVEKYKAADIWKKFYAIKGITEYGEGLVTGVEILSEHDNIYIGESAQLSYQVLPSSSKNKKVSFSSNNPEVVSIGINTGFMQFLSEGEASIVVTTDESKFSDTIDIKVNRRKYTNANLGSLELNFDIKPAFDKNTTDYYATVGSDIDTAAIIAIAEDSLATIKSSSQELKEGDNTIIIHVTAEDTTVSKNYSLHIYKKSSEQRLKSLTTNQGNLNPEFTPDNEYYTWKVSRKTPSLKLTPIVLHSESKSNSIELFYIQDTTIIVTVKAEDERFERFYNINVISFSENANLKDLEITGFTLSPQFNKNTTVYNVRIHQTTQEVNVISTTEDPLATVNLSGLQSTENRLVITTTAEDGITHRNYMLNFQKNLPTAIESPTINESLNIFTIEGRFLGTALYENGKINIPSWIPKGTFIAKGRTIRVKFIN